MNSRTSYCLCCFFLLSMSVSGTLQQNPWENRPSTKDRIVAKGVGGVWEFPNGCDENSNVHACRRIAWKPTVIIDPLRFVMNFEVTGLDVGYVAVAISVDTRMGNDDVYICTPSGVYSGYTTGNSPPVILDEVEDGVVIVESDRISCTFNRPILVTKNVSNQFITWDLAINNYNLLYAEGEVLGGNIFLHHRFQHHTHKAFDLHRNDAYLQVPRDASHISRTDSYQLEKQDDRSTSVNPIDDIYRLDGQVGGTWFIDNHYRNCPEPSLECNEYVQWARVGSDGHMTFIIRGSPQAEWIAMAISRDTTMGDDDCYYCTKPKDGSSEVAISSAFINGFEAPTTVSQESNSFKPVLGSVYNGSLLCIFERNISVTKNISGIPTTWDLANENFNLLFAEGALGEEGQLFPHSFSNHTNGKFNFLNNTGYKSFDDNNEQNTSTPSTPLEEFTTTETTIIKSETTSPNVHPKLKVSTTKSHFEITPPGAGSGNAIITHSKIIIAIFFVFQLFLYL